MLGALLGNYRVMEQLGEGGTGVVYVGQHETLSRRVVVKVLQPELSRNADVVQRFFNEAQAAAAIRNPGIVQIFDFGTTPDGRAYFVMELLEGQSLAARLAQRRLDYFECCRIGRQVANVLQAAHAAGITHRDLKPDNLFLIPDPEVIGGERVKVLDFGIAKLAGEVQASGIKTRTGLTMGAPAYMSPEQCRSFRNADARSDIYSLGCILFEMTCGRPPFVGEGMGDILGAHLHMPPPHPQNLEPHMPHGLSALIAKMLSKHPDARPQKMTAIAQALDDILRTLGPAPRVPTSSPVAAPAPLAPRAPTSSPVAPTLPSDLLLPTEPNATINLDSSLDLDSLDSTLARGSTPPPDPDDGDDDDDGGEPDTVLSDPTMLEATLPPPRAPTPPPTFDATTTPYPRAPTPPPNPDRTTPFPRASTPPAPLPASPSDPDTTTPFPRASSTPPAPDPGPAPAPFPAAPAPPTGYAPAPRSPGPMPLPAAALQPPAGYAPIPPSAHAPMLRPAPQISPGAAPYGRPARTPGSPPRGRPFLLGVVGVVMVVVVIAIAASASDSGSPAPSTNPEIADATSPSATNAADAGSAAAPSTTGALDAECQKLQEERKWGELEQCADKLKPLDPERAADLRTRALEETKAAPRIAAFEAALRAGNLQRARAELDQIWPGSVDQPKLARDYELAETQTIAVLAAELQSVKDAGCEEYNALLARERAAKPARVTAEAARRTPCVPASSPPAPAPAPPAKCDVNALADKGQGQYAAGQLAASLASYEAAYACKASSAWTEKAFIIACNLTNLAKAKLHWKRLPTPMKTRALGICVRNGITEAKLNAP